MVVSDPVCTRVMQYYDGFGNNGRYLDYEEYESLAAAGGTPQGVTLVLNDHLALPAGTLRFKRKGGHGGHNGLRSISAAIGPDYARLKVGIGRPPGRLAPADYVLAQVSKQAWEDLAVTIAHAADAALTAAKRGLDAAMLEYHTSS